MFLFCLLIAFVIVRISEDVTAAARGEKPPRQAIREKKLEARERDGGRVPKGSFGRYATGLIDDAWDSAHHKRELMADHRAEKRIRKAAKKQERQRQKWDRKDAELGGAGFDATVPTPGEAAPAPAASAQPNGPAAVAQPDRPAPAGFYAQVPQPGQGPAAQPSPRPSGYSTLTPKQREHVDGWMRANTAGQRYSLSLEDYFGLPADVRADMVADAWRVGFRPGGDVNGRFIPIDEWDPKAVQQLRERGITEPPTPVRPPSRVPGLGPAALGPRPDEEMEFARLQAVQAAQQLAAQAARKRDEELARQRAEEAARPQDEKPAGGADEKTEPTPDPKEDAETPLPNNVIPFKRNNIDLSRMELPVTNPEITGLESAIAYAQGMNAQCTHAYDQINAILPTGDEAAASCELARANLTDGGVTGQSLTDISSVQEQMTGAIQELQAALSQLEAAAAAADSLATELTSHRGVQEAYAATPDAGSKEFNTAE